MQVVEHELKESTLYKLEKASVSHCWSRMKNEVLRSIGAQDFIAVPYIQDNASYDLGAVVFKKHKLIKEFFYSNPPDALPVATLENLLKPGHPIPPDVVRGLTSSVAVTRDPPLEPDHSFKQVRRAADDEDRSKVSLKLHSVHVKKLQDHLGITGVVLDLQTYAEDFRVHKLYLVYEVLYSADFLLTVIAGQSRRQYKRETAIPIGFKLCQYMVSGQTTLTDPRRLPTAFRVRWRSQAGQTASVVDEKNHTKELVTCMSFHRTKTAMPVLLEEDSYLPSKSEEDSTKSSKGHHSGMMDNR